ncbi:MAG: hypothetical protein JXB48_06335, partial [Candidatus Latescibacteria bacterium]|nr:hypothetical protein [Candidatus Latescibacterota bacterium]
LLASKIKKRLPVSAVYRFPTANDLADFTDRYDPAMSELIDEFRFHFGEGDKVLYCFPPYGATGIVYHTMSRFLKGYRLECFNFLDGIDFVEEAVRILLPESRKSPLILLGYSGGGNLAFEVAFEIEKYGGSIERLILIDSYRRMESVKVSRARHEQEMKKILTSDEYTVFFPDSHSRNKALQNGVAYAEYLCSVIEKGFVHAQIDVLRAHDDIPDPSRDRFGALRSRGKWSELTNATFHMIQGTGTHDEMLNEKNSLQNSILIRQILEDCTT